MTAPFGIFEALRLVGALGLFIYGMKIMSEGIQKTAGNTMRNILGAMTSNRFTGLFTGFITTVLIQYSSATNVMIVSFVNAGLLTLRQAIGVMMGANIGTTVKALLILLFGFGKFNLSDWVLPLFALGLPVMFFRSSQAKSLGETVVGFALLFMGLDALKNSVPIISPDQLEFLIGLGEYGIFSTMLFVLVGTVLTIVILSSSATVALTIILCERGMPFEVAAAIVLGANIGTTITANLAAIIGNVHAKRTAATDSLLNIFGVVLVIPVLPFFLDAINTYLATTVIGASNPTNIHATMWALSCFHLLFNIVNVLLFIGLIEYLAQLATWFIPAKNDADERFALEYIGSGIMSTPELSLVEAQKELVKFGGITHRMLGIMKELLYEKDKKEQILKLERLGKYEEITDRLEVEVADYLLTVSQGEISEDASKKVRSMLGMVSELEQVGDVFYQMSKTMGRKFEAKAWFTLEQRNGLLEMLDALDNAFANMEKNLSGRYEDIDLHAAEAIEAEINTLRDKLRKEHLDAMGAGNYNMESGMIYTDLFSQMEKIGDHVMQVNEAIAGKI